jgi:hypothetical protein
MEHGYVMYALKKKLVSAISARLKCETRNSYYRLQRSDIYSILFNVRVTDRYICELIVLWQTTVYGLYIHIDFIHLTHPQRLVNLRFLF